MRFLHPWFGVAFTLGVVWMLVSWAKDMRFDAGDREWLGRLKTYAGSGHTGLDTGRYNAGQKGYYWFSVIFGLVLLVTGLPLWYPWLAGARDCTNIARFLHHADFLLMVGGFMHPRVHVDRDVPGDAVGHDHRPGSRAWAAFHHPAGSGRPERP